MATDRRIQAEIDRLEKRLQADKRKLAALRRKRVPQPVEDYRLLDSLGRAVRLSELFGARQELVVVHNMGLHCSSCTTWADGFNGVLKHLEDRAAFVVESPVDPHVQRQFAADRGWAFRMVSSKGSTFRKDMGYADAKGNPWPGISAFTRKDGKLQRVADAAFGPGDNFCIVWDVADLLPGGWKDWDVNFFYSRASRRA
jgi:predicted dithiol-disulfide oxidoreductase (DUF899 family)